MRIIDGLVNLVAGLGTGRDKGAHGEYTLPTMDTAKAFTAYKASSLVRRVVDLPAEDACREWREWQAEATDITAIEAEEKRLGVQGKVIEARRQARLFGGAALFIGDGTATPDKPLDPEKMGKDGLKYLTVMSRDDVSAGDLDRDPASKTFGKPQFWNMTGKNGVPLVIHPSRLVLFHGIAPFAGIRYDTGMGWGDSVLTGMLERLRAVDEVAANILSLVYEAKIDVIKVPDLMQNLQSRGDAYASEVLRRMQLANTAKGNSGALIIDAKEEYQQKNASFGGLPDITDRFMQLAASAAGIPMTLLFEQSPGGLNATGDNDTRGYYDRIKVQQTLHMQPEMALLDECLIRSGLGSRPDELHYTWKPLWQPTARERADVGKISAETMQMATKMGAVSEEAAGSALVNALTESGAFPGLEGYAEEFPMVPDDLDEALGGDDLPASTVGDGTHRTLYVSRKVLNATEIIRWAKQQGFSSTLPADDLHVTIAFSRHPVDWMECGESWSPKVEVAPGGARQMEQFGEARVLLFASEELKWRHDRIKDCGATWDHPDYQPHITISYDPEAPDIGDIEAYQGPIILGPEIFAEVRED